MALRVTESDRRGPVISSVRPSDDGTYASVSANWPGNAI
jgi:hypothetical protein